MLACTVRGCGQALARDDRRWVCPNQHSFDIARSGYVNLLQPQDRRSKNPGDTAQAAAARRRLHDRGVTAPLLEAILEAVAPLPTDTILDAGCGEGFYVGSLAERAHCQALGIDISIPAVDLAARRYPACQWIVANADRAIPAPDSSFSGILSITGRRNAPEFRRVLQPDGRLLMAIPAPTDLIELRGKGRDRAERTVEEFAPHFTLAAQTRVTAVAQLPAAAVEDLLLSIYRPLRAQPAVDMNLTFSLDLLLFRIIQGS